MDRASDSGSEGWGFESLPVYHEKTVIVIQSRSFQLSLPFGQVKLPLVVKLLRSEVSPGGEVGKLNFALCDSTKLHYAIGITSHRQRRYFTNKNDGAVKSPKLKI